ncbi:DUF262 domain-containing protein [Hymenobacter negativus]|uniref:DUF262 domain-containing protein n=1 Tax=Hymenobacter negativus TaxID=2795026 RepID=A0ABS3QJE1_9BACT|nr:DUF262 domain-containing protein [Hymenobacter negativus]MBO2010899.1 DUF262 domain-containing protein [Hymenobacter negativus]
MSSESKVVDLISQVDAALEKAHLQSLDISFNELMGMKIEKELVIDPDYQRLFQWSEGAQSRFIESLLLGMPVPPIYVIEIEEGKYSLIDGLQRISSYLHFRGALEAKHKGISLGDELTLSDCDIVSALNGKKFKDLGTTLQIRLKRAFIRVEVVKKASDVRFKYHMFKRLNTGGEKLTDQQIRNCTIRMLDPQFNDYIASLSADPSFASCVGIITDDQKDGWFDRELVLRFFAFKNQLGKFRHDVRDFLTDYMEAVSEPDPLKRLNFDYQNEKADFEKTFQLFAKTLGEKAFGFPNKNRDAITKGFSAMHFEALTLGIQKHLKSIDLSNQAEVSALATKLADLKLNPEFVKLTSGGGKNSPGLLKARIKFVEDFL